MPWPHPGLKGRLSQPPSTHPLPKAEEAGEGASSRLICREPAVLALPPAAMKLMNSPFPLPG